MSHAEDYSGAGMRPGLRAKQAGQATPGRDCSLLLLRGLGWQILGGFVRWFVRRLWRYRCLGGGWRAGRRKGDDRDVRSPEKSRRGGRSAGRRRTRRPRGRGGDRLRGGAGVAAYRHTGRCTQRPQILGRAGPGKGPPIGPWPGAQAFSPAGANAPIERAAGAERDGEVGLP